MRWDQLQSTTLQDNLIFEQSHSIISFMINKEILGHKNTNLGFEKHKFPTISPQDLEAGLQALQTEDPFKTLGVTEENTAKEINARYRDLMKKLHPDIVGDGAGDFLVVFNRMTQKITEAGAKLKDHCPPPKTLAEAVYQRLSQEDFEQKSAQDQLNLLVSRLYEYGVDTTSADITGGMESAYAIMNILQRAREHRLVIQRAYEGELGFQPLDNKPLPDLNEVLQLLKAARIYKSWRPKINEYHGVRMPSREQEAYFCVESIFVPHTERKPDNIPDWRYETNHINFISNFH